jgi:acyl dehydratase
LEPKFYEDFQVGEKYATPARTVTETDIVNYCCLSGDSNPIHTDDEYAKKTQFKSRIAPGPLIVAISSGLRGRLGINEGAVLLEIDKLRFSSPVKPGDTIHLELTVASKRETSKAERGIVTLGTVVLNQRQEVVSTYETTLMVKRKKP